MRQLATLILLFALASSAGAQDFRVTLLGTGDPIPRPDRYGPATLVQVAGLDATFLTHFHHDHLIGLDDRLDTR
jgi:ribonuclease Z